MEQTQRDFQQRIQLREKDLQELREVVKTHKVSWHLVELKHAQLKLSSKQRGAQSSPTEAHGVMCPNSALQKKQCETLRGTLLN